MHVMCTHHWCDFGKKKNMKKFKYIFVLFLFSISNIFAQENFNKQIDSIVEKNYFISCYFDVLKSKNRESIKKYGDIFNDITYQEPEGWITRKWYDESVFSFDTFELSYDLSEKRFDNIFHIGTISLTVKKIEFLNDYSVITLQQGTFNNKEYDDHTLLNWPEFRKAESTKISSIRKKNKSIPVYINDFIFVEDGDYLKIYYDKDKLIPFATFARMNDETLEQFKNLIYNNKCDLSKVTWPRHADGTCDYDDSSKSSKTAVSTSSTTPAPSTNVTVNKTMLVTETLKLRSGEATTTSVLTVMQAGTKVKILELGKAETIDGIDSNWVKVEVQKGAKDRDGKEIKEGTVGWCYGGYLQ